MSGPKFVRRNKELVAEKRREMTIVSIRSPNRNRDPIFVFLSKSAFNSIIIDHYQMYLANEKFQLQIDFPFAQWISFIFLFDNFPFSVNGFLFRSLVLSLIDLLWCFLHEIAAYIGTFFFSHTLRHNTQQLAAHQSRSFDTSQILVFKNCCMPLFCVRLCVFVFECQTTDDAYRVSVQLRIAYCD